MPPPARLPDLKTYPDLRLVFEGNIARASGDMMFRGLPRMNVRPLEELEPYLARLFTRLEQHRAAKSNGHDPSEALEMLHEAGRQLYRTATLWGRHYPLADVLEKALSLTQPVISIEGNYHSLPWELMRVPADRSPTRKEQWLGELALISCLDHDGAEDTPFAKSRISISAAHRSDNHILAIFGAGLTHVEEEKRYLASLQAAGFSIYEFSPTDREELNAGLSALPARLSSGLAPHFVHIAAHVTTGFSNGFAIRLIEQEDTSHIQIEEKLSIGSSEVTIKNLALLNTCTGYVAAANGSVSLASLMLNRMGSRACIASICRVPDADASGFGAEMVEALLPVSTDKVPMTAGQALFVTRNRFLTEKDSLIGFYYKLIGEHQIGYAYDADPPPPVPGRAIAKPEQLQAQAQGTGPPIARMYLTGRMLLHILVTSIVLL